MILFRFDIKFDSEISHPGHIQLMTDDMDMAGSCVNLLTLSLRTTRYPEVTWCGLGVRRNEREPLTEENVRSWVKLYFPSSELIINNAEDLAEIGLALETIQKKLQRSNQNANN